jgi:hypothetical protein
MASCLLHRDGRTSAPLGVWWFDREPHHEYVVDDTYGSGWTGDERFDLDKESDRHGFLTRLVTRAFGDPS